MACEQQSRGRQIGARDLGRVVRRAAHEIFERVEADGAARDRCVRRGPARWLAEAWLMRATCSTGQARPRRMAGHARHAAIDYGADAFDGDGAFRHVGGEDDLAAARDGPTARSCSSGD